jgi:hypothetical protein
MAQVITAAAEGVMAGARINADLIEEETRWAVEGHFGPFSAASEAAASTIVLGDRRHGLDDVDDAGAISGAPDSPGIHRLLRNGSFEGS